MYYALLTLFVIVAVLLIILSLLQKGRGDVGAAFGGAMGQSIFGAGGVDTILTKATYWLGGTFLVLAVLLSVVPRGEKGSILEKSIQNESTGIAPEGPAKVQERRGDNTGTPAEEESRRGSDQRGN
jgi:preprotein translocase subunit SecG